ncbi:hypothetical protein CHH62_09035, partial [Niallia circulans]
KFLLTESLDYIILDFPFSYKHSQVSKFIDFSIFIDTPLDIALARRVTRDFCNSPTEDILSEMKNYTSRGRRGYLNMLETIKPDADFVIDGTLQAAEVINVILDNLKN